MEGLMLRSCLSTSAYAFAWMLILCSLVPAQGRSERPAFPDYSKLCEAETFNLLYDARIGWIHAGQLSVDICIDGSDYFFTGLFRTGGPIENFIRWNGRFTSVGRLTEELPRSSAYLVIEENIRKDNSKIVLAAHNLTTIHGRNRSSRSMEHPPGNDLMSALFLSGGCRDHMIVHDGEDPYDIALVGYEPDDRINQGRSFFTGEALRCKYRFTYHTGKVRKVDVWWADVKGRPFPVRIRVRVPILPDAVFRLRLGEPR